MMTTEDYVLIVDDDPDARKIMERILVGLGLSVQVAEDGRVALDLIRSRKPALILLDLMMPCMNGFEVLFHLRATPETRSIPIVVVSAVTQNELLKLPGVSKVFRKAGMRVTDVQETVSSLLNKHQAQIETEAQKSA